MFKNALLSIKKNFGKTILLFVLMCVIANLVIAGLSIKSATSKSMDQVRQSLGSEVTLSYNMMNMMKNREKGAAMDEVMNNITVAMADQLKGLKYVESYNYTMNIGVTSDDIDPVKTSQEETSSQNDRQFPGGDNAPKMMDSNDFTVVGNTTMAHLSDFTNENYVLKNGRLLTNEDANTKNCVIETNLATDNDLSVGDTFTVTTTNSDDEEISVKLKIVGIFEIETSSQMGGMMSNRQNPINQIYTDLSVAQTLNESTTEISSATYYLDDPEHIDAFKTLAKSSSDIDFETYTLDANDQIYQRSISSLENMEEFATIFLWVVVGAGSAILCLILILTMRSRFYEFGVFLSLGQSKFKIVCQQFIEVLLIAAIAFMISLGTGKMVSNVVSSMLESSQNNQKQMTMNMPEDNQNTNQSSTQQKPNDLFNQAIQSPENSELDVSLTSSTVIQLAEITGAICLISVVLPSIYILRLSPREILVKKEG
ncbi:MAG: ABC transporter permease [Longibaculum sp.]